MRAPRCTLPPAPCTPATNSEKTSLAELAHRSHLRRAACAFVYKGASLAVVTALLEAYEDGAATPMGVPSDDPEEPVIGPLPLHLAVSHSASLEVVLALLAAHVEASLAPDAHGRVPLHCAVLGSAAVGRSPPQHAALVTALLQADSEAIRATDHDGSTPLHLALANDAVPDEVAMLVLDAYPEAAWEADASGKLPLHVAFEREQTKAASTATAAALPDSAVRREVTWKLLTLNPDAARAIDVGGRVGASAGVVSALPRSITTASPASVPLAP